MSIFGNIMDAIFGISAEAAPQESPGAEAIDTSATSGDGVDVAAILDGLAAENKQKLKGKV